jgi:hypothetical protein
MILAMFQPDERTMAIVSALMSASGGSNKTLAVALNVPEGSIARMKAGHDAGPGVTRLGWCSASWWIAFIKHVAPLFGLTVIENHILAEYLNRNDRIQGRMLQMQLADSGDAAKECA